MWIQPWNYRSLFSFYRFHRLVKFVRDLSSHYTLLSYYRCGIPWAIVSKQGLTGSPFPKWSSRRDMFILLTLWTFGFLFSLSWLFITGGQAMSKIYWIVAIFISCLDFSNDHTIILHLFTLSSLKISVISWYCTRIARGQKTGTRFKWKFISLIIFNLLKRAEINRYSKIKVVRWGLEYVPNKLQKSEKGYFRYDWGWPWCIAGRNDVMVQHAQIYQLNSSWTKEKQRWKSSMKT